MPRITNNVAAHRRRKKYMLNARGYFGNRIKTYRATDKLLKEQWSFLLLIVN